VDAEKLRAELEAAKHSIIDLEENLKDKGEKVKSIGEKSSLEVKQLKEKIIGLNSSVELKEFQVGQLEGQVTTLK
jgi:predicted RNase H-like nuclease (RuvC/YqgF family)